MTNARRIPLHTVVADQRPPEQQLIERRLRQIGNNARNLTGMILGDPPIGRSALDKKIAKEREGSAAARWEDWRERVRKHALPPVA